MGIITVRQAAPDSIGKPVAPPCQTQPAEMQSAKRDRPVRHPESAEKGNNTLAELARKGRCVIIIQRRSHSQVQRYASTADCGSKMPRRHQFYETGCAEVQGSFAKTCRCATPEERHGRRHNQKHSRWSESINLREYSHAVLHR